MKTESPEDRLLNLIKGKYRKKPEGKEAFRAGEKTFLRGLAKKAFLQNKFFKSAATLRSLNRGLIVLLVILLGYLSYTSIINLQRNIDSFVVIKGDAEPPKIDVGTKEDKGGSEARDFAVHSKALGGKNLFSAPREKVQVTGPAELDISARFNLVGIIAGADPQAIIEDKETQKTHYLNKGQSFSGVTVEKVGEGKVVLHYEGKEITLVL